MPDRRVASANGVRLASVFRPECIEVIPNHTTKEAVFSQFLVLGPFEQREQHFELMGRLSALMRDKTTLMFLQGHRTPREVYEYLTDLDARAGEGPGGATGTLAGGVWKQPALSTGRG